MLQDVKSYLGRSFAMKDLGDAAYILGIKIYRDRSKRLIGLNQSAYIEKILKRFYMENSRRGNDPMQEKLIIETWTSDFNIIRVKNMGLAVKNIFKYLSRTKDSFGIWSKKVLEEFKQMVCVILNGGDVDWKVQNKYFEPHLQMLNISLLLTHRKRLYGFKNSFLGWHCPTIEEPISMYCDNTGAIAIAKDDGVTKGARHFRAKVHYLRETIKMGDVRIEKIDTDLIYL
ncbi:retrotransposon protein, putative, ty1-copia subclass [Tanacetum coccineum]